MEIIAHFSQQLIEMIRRIQLSKVIRDLNPLNHLDLIDIHRADTISTEDSFHIGKIITS